jgi:hypothetical protein
MRFKLLLFSTLFLLLASACRKNVEKEPLAPPEGVIKLSELQNEHDYYLPFAIENDTSIIQSVLLNDKAVEFGSGDFIDFKENGFYSLILKYNSKEPNDTFLFTTITKERENSEWGIKEWVPAAFKSVSLGSETIETFFPRRYTDAVKVPFIFYIRESGLIKAVYCQGKTSFSTDVFNIKRGVGSVNIASSSLSGNNDFNIGGKNVNVALSKINETPVLMSGLITTNVIVPANSFVKIQSNLTVSSTGSLTVQ